MKDQHRQRQDGQPRRSRRLLMTAAVIALMSAPAHFGCQPEQKQGGPQSQKPQKPEAVQTAEQLRQRAMQLWDANRDQDCRTVFAFRDPPTRDQQDVEKFCEWYAKEEPFLIRSYKLIDVAAQPPMGWAKLDYETNLRRYPTLPPRQVQIWEKWRVVDGEWYPVPSGEVDAYPAAPAERDLAEEKKLAARFDACCVARRDKDWSRFYQFCDPRFRAEVTEAEFKEGMGLIEYRSHTVHWMQVLGDRGLVRVEMEYTVNDPSLSKMPPRRQLINELWVRVNDEWFLDLKGP